jgi:hypothetical protein
LAVVTSSPGDPFTGGGGSQAIVEFKKDFLYLL